MAGVVLRNLNKAFTPGVPIVRDVNLKVEDKEFLVLVGPSGCGKSTTLRMIAGLEPATSGDIFIGDRRVNDVAPRDRDIAMVFQDYAIYPHMSVYGNMAFGLRRRKFAADTIDRRVRDAARILGIEDLLDRRPRSLSGGERQRVAVGRAIVRKPQVFLFDEPLSNLDAKLRIQMRAEIGKLHARLMTTMIYVTHDQVEAMTMGDRIAVMKDGLVQQVAEPLDLYDHPANRFVAGFIGSPPMNFVEGRIEEERGRLVFHEGSFRLPILSDHREKLEAGKGRAVTFGIRPEDIHDARLTAESPERFARMRAKVELIEPMGSELYLYLRAGEADLIARVPPHTDVVIDDEITLLIDLPKCHFFDSETGTALV